MVTGSNSPAARGLEGIVAAQTRLSHVDGLAGQLIIRGYSLEDLAGRVSFEEAAHLLWRGALPSRSELSALTSASGAKRSLPANTLQVVRAAAKALPIDALRMACATLSLDVADLDDLAPEAELAHAMMLTARFPTVVAAHSRIAAGQEPIPPSSDLSPSANFLYMLRGKEPDAIAARALDTYWVTVIDHGMSASTFTARVIASTRSDMVSAVSGAIGALKGPLHGGAPGPVLDMLVSIGTADNAERWIRDRLARAERIMGFGHRVYKVRDPRAEVLRKVAESLSSARLEDRKLFDLARHVEQVASRLLEEHKPGRNLRTNVEFYTALVLQAMGLEPRQFTAMFACGRVAGWCAHVIEQRGEDRLIRPQSQYVGPRGLQVDR